MHCDSGEGAIEMGGDDSDVNKMPGLNRRPVPGMHSTVTLCNHAFPITDPDHVNFTIVTQIH